MNAKLHYIKIRKDGVPEVKLQVGDEIIVLHTDPVDVVEVVRCKDCKHQNEDGDCDIHDGWVTRKPDSFCCYGDKKNGG